MATVTKQFRKPHKDFPLFPHATGRWAKKIRGKFCYFGKVADDPEGEKALEKWIAEKDCLLAGRVPRPKTDGLTVTDLVNRFLTSKKLQCDVGRIQPRTFSDYMELCNRVVQRFGNRLVNDLAPTDFEQLFRQLSTTLGVAALGRYVANIRSIFGYAYHEGLIVSPVRFGQVFRSPSKKELRKHRHSQPPKLFEPKEIHATLAVADAQMKAMILLGLNCGFGNTDVSTLPRSAIVGEWVNFPRPKTGNERRCWLWPETVAALEQVRQVRPKPKSRDDADLMFVTTTGQRWTHMGERNWIDGVSYEFRKTMKAAGVHRPGRGFYTLRHTFRTIADETLDQVAAGAVMGHADGSMATIYRERIDDSRLRRVAEHVRAWLFGNQEIK